jgi:hypothetical protein
MTIPVRGTAALVVAAAIVAATAIWMKRSGLPNQFLDVLLHTIACSELARVRTELS